MTALAAAAAMTALAATAPEPPTCIALQRRPASAPALFSAAGVSGGAQGGLAVLAAGGWDLTAELRSAAAAAAAPIAVVLPAAAAVVSRIDALQKGIGADLRRLRRLHTPASSADVEATFGGAFLEGFEQLAELLSNGLSSLAISAPLHVAAAVMALPESEGHIMTHIVSRVLHRHKGSLPPTRIQGKSNNPTRVARKQRQAGRAQATADSDEAEHEPRRAGTSRVHQSLRVNLK